MDRLVAAVVAVEAVEATFSGTEWIEAAATAAKVEA
jgi:hypothetical protein